MTLINFVAANQKYYAFNLLSVFIIVFWSVILISNMQTDINHNENKTIFCVCYIFSKSMKLAVPHRDSQ
ncbi:hypothetical protein R643_21890 [Salmonella enterica subsp. enterica serovar Tennessee]|nr:hypothetical protein Y596_22935 [Salmonella enterica subsp. enterica serovar Tennessee]KWR28230.1 hypothetical protein R643_21890 [Salmonella enterica subsp. enterica serovar Tennessee]